MTRTPVSRSSTVVLVLLLTAALAAPAAAETTDPVVIGGSVSPSVITAGDVAYATVEISEAAPPSQHGFWLSLSPSNAWDRVPATGLSHVNVPPGDTTVTFPIWMSTYRSTEPRVVELTARPVMGEAVVFAVLTVLPADPAERAVVSFTGPDVVLDGEDVEPEVVLNTTAPANGLAINIMRNTVYGPGFNAANHLFFEPGSDRAAHPMRAGTTVPAIVTTTADLGTSEAKWETLIVPQAFAVGSGYIRAGDAFRTGVGIGTAANPTGTTVHLETDTPGVTVPASVVVPAGEPGVAFAIDVAGWVRADRAEITATWNGTTTTGLLVIGPPLSGGEPPPAEEEPPPVDEEPPPPPANEPPVASFTASCDELRCRFTDTAVDADGTVTARRWQFGDGMSATTTTPTHTYAEAGTYTVTLMVTDDDGAADTASRTLTVDAPPTASSLHVADLDGDLVRSRRERRATVTHRVVDDLGRPVTGATVRGAWSSGGTSTCVTTAAGTCSVEAVTRLTRSTWTVAAVHHPTLSYAPQRNRDPDGDSDGTTIQLDRR